MTQLTDAERGQRALDLLAVIGSLLANGQLDGPRRWEVMEEIQRLTLPSPQG
jgi:hypothetical protein